MSEGPISFGKPMAFLVLIGVAAGGYWFYKNWPTTHEGNGWSVGFPPRWKITKTETDRVEASGPLQDDVMGQGIVTLHTHGTLDWPRFVFESIIVVPDWQEEYEIDYKKGMLFTFDDGDLRFLASSVDRGDLLVTTRVGCAKDAFEKNRPILEKAVKSVKCMR